MERNFGGVIWTNHALQRLKEREIKQSDAWYTFQKPDQSRFAQSQGGWIYYKDYKNQRIEVVAKQNERKEWIILSVWSTWARNYQPKKMGFLRLMFKSLFGF